MDEVVTLIAGLIPSEVIQRCGGAGLVSTNWMAVQPLTYHTLHVQVDPIGFPDTNPDNNRAAYSVYIDLPKLYFLPFIVIK